MHDLAQCNMIGRWLFDSGPIGNIFFLLEAIFKFQSGVLKENRLLAGLLMFQCRSISFYSSLVLYVHDFRKADYQNEIYNAK